MTVIFEEMDKESFKLRVSEIEDGKAYEDERGDIYIGNCCGGIIAFSLSGNAILYANAERRLREITIHVKKVYD